METKDLAAGSAAAAKKTVTVEIATNDIKTLRENGYALCVAKKVEGAAYAEYDVVWQAYGRYFASNEFSWTPQFQVFGSIRFMPPQSVEINTQLADMRLGEQITLENNATFNRPTVGGDPTALNLINKYGPLNFGIRQSFTSIDGNTAFGPMFVTPDRKAEGTFSLKPVDKVLIWFEQNVNPSTVFMGARARAIELDLTGTDRAICRYENDHWSIVRG